MSYYKAVVVQNGVDYSPKFVEDSYTKGIGVSSIISSTGHWNKYLIDKFMVMANSGASAIKIWPVGVDVTNNANAIDVPTTALVAGNEYSLSIGKITWTGTLTILGYYLPNMPLDYQPA